MKYIVRLNPKAFNPVTKRVIPERLWEVEQVANKDSEKVIWHCADIRIDQTPIRELFSLTPSEGKATWEYECFGICVRGQDNAIEIKTGRSDVSGN
jgi:hypothetical protein